MRYTFLTEDDPQEQVDLHMSLSEYRKRTKNGRIKLDDGRMAKLDWSAFGNVSSVPGNYPMESDAMGVGVHQVEKAAKADAAAGVPTEYNKRTGAVIFRDKEHRRAYCERHGVFDRNGGHSDPQRGGRN